MQQTLFKSIQKYLDSETISILVQTWVTAQKLELWLTVVQPVNQAVRTNKSSHHQHASRRCLRCFDILKSGYQSTFLTVSEDLDHRSTTAFDNKAAFFCNSMRSSPHYQNILTRSWNRIYLGLEKWCAMLCCLTNGKQKCKDRRVIFH